MTGFPRTGRPALHGYRACLLALALAFLSVGHVLANTFLWDDASIIIENLHIRSLDRIAQVFSPAYWSRFQGLSYRPLAHATYFLDYAMWGHAPAGYHLSNVLLHAANTLLVWLAVRAMMGRDRTALFAALLFAVHPVHVESLAFVKNRSEMLATFFALASILLLTNVGGGWRLAAAPACFALGLLSKASIVLLPFALLPLCHGRRDGGGIAWRRRAVAVMCTLSVACVCVRVFAIGGGLRREGAAVPLHLRPLAAAKTIGAYLGLGLVPRGLTVDRSFVLPTDARDGLAWLAVALTVVGGIAGVRRLRQNREAVVWGLWFVALLLPSSNLIPMPWRPLAEQRAYAASAGLCALMGLCLGQNARRIGGRVALAACVLASFATLSLKHVCVMRNDKSMWEDAVRKSPARPQPHLAFGNLLLEQGRLSRARREYDEALEVDPKYWWARCGIAMIHEASGDFAGAEAEYEAAHRVAPDAHKPMLGLAQLAERRKDYERAIAIYRGIVEQHPRLAKMWGKLGLALWHAGKPEQARRALGKALEIEPHMEDARECLAQLFAARAIP